MSRHQAFTGRSLVVHIQQHLRDRTAPEDAVHDEASASKLLHPRYTSYSDPSGYETSPLYCIRIDIAAPRALL